MSKGYLNWYLNLDVNKQVQLFRYYRIISSSNIKHWCLNDINKEIKYIKDMLKELRIEGQRIYSNKNYYFNFPIIKGQNLNL